MKKKIYIAGHNGMVGSSIYRALRGNKDYDIIVRSRSELDLTNQAAVHEFLKREHPAEIYIAAAKVGGIFANSTYPAQFIYENLMIEANIINSAFKAGVRKLIFLGSSCIYPRLAPQPIDEEALLTGPLEPTNESYAIAKIAGLKLCQSYNREYSESHGLDYRSVMPTNLYGIGDNYHPRNAHVIPALIRRFHEAVETHASEVVVWGSGTPLREFLYVDDMAAACIHIMNIEPSIYYETVGPNVNHINVGSGEEFTIRELAEKIAKTVKFSGRIQFDSSKPDGTPRKLINSKKLNDLGWMPEISIDEGLVLAYRDFRNQIK
jgi:GDP-L-fucose synthase